MYDIVNPHETNYMRLKFAVSSIAPLDVLHVHPPIIHSIRIVCQSNSKGHTSQTFNLFKTFLGQHWEKFPFRINYKHIRSLNLWYRITWGFAQTGSLIRCKRFHYAISSRIIRHVLHCDSVLKWLSVECPHKIGDYSPKLRFWN